MSIWVLIPIFFVLAICAFVIVYAICMGCSGYKPFQSNQQKSSKLSNSSHTTFYQHDINEDNHHHEHHRDSDHEDTDSIEINDDSNEQCHEVTIGHKAATGVALDAVSGVTELTSLGGGISSHNSGGGDSGWTSSRNFTSGATTYDSGGGNSYDESSKDVGGYNYDN